MNTNTNIDIDAIYPKVRSIVHKLRRNSYIKLWDKNDWDQEGLITLYLLLEKHKELINDERLLCVYFKTKFSNYVNDMIRKQESQKRRFDRLPYEEISEVAHAIKSQKWDSSEQIAFNDCCTEVFRILTFDEREKIEKIMRGERFNGKKRFLRRLAVAFKEFEQSSLS